MAIGTTPARICRVCYLTLKTKFMVSCPVLFCHCKGYNSNLRTIFHYTFVEYDVRGRSNDIAKIFACDFKLLPTKPRYMFKQVGIYL